MELFSCTAVLYMYWSDRGPPSNFPHIRHLDTKHSPYYPQSTRTAEATVKSMKKIFKAAWNGRFLDNEKLCKALLQTVTFHLQEMGLSPAQKLLRCPIQDTIQIICLWVETQCSRSRKQGGRHSTSRQRCEILTIWTTDCSLQAARVSISDTKAC